LRNSTTIRTSRCPHALFTHPALEALSSKKSVHPLTKTKALDLGVLLMHMLRRPHPHLSSNNEAPTWSLTAHHSNRMPFSSPCPICLSSNPSCLISVDGHVCIRSISTRSSRTAQADASRARLPSGGHSRRTLRMPARDSISSPFSSRTRRIRGIGSTRVAFAFSGNGMADR
jgi:hypothetical protein